jgi:Spy/CpxP family protein refolding chaperone
MASKFFTGALLLAGLTLSWQPASAQPPGGGFQFGGGFGGGGLLGSVNDANVQKELELLDDQVEKLRDLQRKIGEARRESFQGVSFRELQQLPEDERRAKFEEMRTKSDEKRKELEKEAENILLPSQVERLKQINIQNQLRSRSTADVLASSELKAELNLTDAQIEELKKAQEEAQAELRKKLERVQEEAREKVLSVLTPEQRAKIKKLMGAKIEFSPPQFGGFGGRGQGGRGQRGGDRPGN